MEQKRNYYPHFEIFIKFLISYLVITLVFTIPLWLLYRTALNNAKESIVKDSYANMQKGYVAIENEILNLNKLAAQLRSDNSFQKITRLNGEIPKDQVYYLVRAYNRMRDSGFSSDLVFDNYMIFRQNNIAISRSQIITDTNNLKEYLIPYENWNQYVFDNPKQIMFMENVPVKYRTSVFSPYENKEIIHCILSLPVDNPRQFDSAMLVQLDSEQILHRLASEEILQHGFLYITNSNNEIIYRYHYEGDLLNLPRGISEYKWKGMDTNILNHTQSLFGLNIVAGIPDSAYMEKISSMTQILIIFVLSAVLLGIALALFFAYRKSRLLNGIIDTIRTFTQPIHNTGKNEFDYIRNSLIQIDHSNQNYKQQMAAVQEDMKIYLTQKLLNGQPCNSREKENFIRYYDIRHPFFAVLVLSRTDMDLDPSDTAGAESAEAFHLVLHDAIMRNMSQSHIICNLSTSSCAVILNLPEEEACGFTRMDTQLIILRDMVLKSTGNMINIGISDPCNGLDDLSKCFWQARQALIQMEEDSNNGVRHYQSLHKHAAGNIYDPSTALKLNDLILMGETESVNHLFVAIWQRLLRHPISDAHENRQVMLSIRNTLSHAASLLGKEDEASGDISVFREEDTPEDSLKALHRSALRLAQRAQKLKNDRAVRLRDCVVQYLKQNYPDPNLCAAQVATKFSLSEKYVFHIVKEHTGKSFSEYLEGIRFEESEKLLANSDLAINIISEQVGFNSVNTFHKAFKRIYGVTPGAWRSQRLKSAKVSDILQSQNQGM